MMRNLFARPISLGLRLMLFVSLATVCVLLLFGRYIAYTVEEHFVDQDAQALIVMTKNLQELIDADLDRDRFLFNVDRILLGQSNSFAYIEEENGKVLYEPNNTVLVDMVHQKKQNRQKPIQKLQTWKDGLGDDYRVYLTKVQLKQGGSVTIVAGINIHFHEHYLNQFHKNLWLTVLFACFVMFGVTWFAIRKGHQPLMQINQRIQNITSENLHSRLNAATVPKELVSLVESFNVMIGHIEEVFERQSHFSADIAHELRTPITNMVTQTQIVLGKARTLEEYQDALYSNLEELERMSKMVNDMLFLSQTENKRAVFDKEKIDLKKELLALFEYVDVWVEDQNLVLDLQGDAPNIEGNRLMIQRVLNNLLSNAIRHAQTGSEIQILLYEDAGYSVLEMSNNIEEEIKTVDVDRLFERFYRTDVSRQNKGTGAGIGLAIVRSIVEVHKGSISTSLDQRKITFTIKFKL